jgi:hypothetical protein
MQMPILTLARNSNPSDLVPSVHKETPIHLERETPNQARVPLAPALHASSRNIGITIRRNPERQTTSWFGI